MEFVRHRVFSFAQESTRYCNYSKDKFGNDLTFILPNWLDLEEGEYIWEDQNPLVTAGLPADSVGYSDASNLWMKFGDGLFSECQRNYDDWWQTEEFMHSLQVSKDIYLNLLRYGWKPQQARAILPNSLKTELVMTGFVSDWWGKTNIIKDNRLIQSISNSSPNLEAETGKYDASYRIVRNGFFGLRCAPSAHPQAQELAIPLREEFIKRKYLSE